MTSEKKDERGIRAPPVPFGRDVLFRLAQRRRRRDQIVADVKAEG
jgi:hypothetical protein